MQYGVDIANTRLDDLDKRVLETVTTCVGRSEEVAVLEVGCGQGGLTVALAEAGAKVTALDIDNYGEVILAQHSLSGLPVQFVQTDIRDWVAKGTSLFTIVVMQRLLHYLPYGDARLLLEKLRQITDTLYLSVTGTTTAIANHYNALALPLAERWGMLDETGQELFTITAPLCLYSEAEIRTLLGETGWEIEWLRVSDFGNIKVMAKRN
ncbi:MAG: class I SAM-dependent methyltransferase [Candidatus Pacebacteria bacterium]|jgi:SAM-dependent methyltransferase|nr:class I SAM-dependent methyltransferase [Candidatus Paceibacterota bacterium]